VYGVVHEAPRFILFLTLKLASVTIMFDPEPSAVNPIILLLPSAVFCTHVTPAFELVQTNPPVYPDKLEPSEEDFRVPPIPVTPER
jgi:hypothetical protein